MGVILHGRGPVIGIPYRVGARRRLDIVWAFERCFLLNLPRLHTHCRDIKAEVLGNLDGIEFRRVITRCDLLERMKQSAVNGILTSNPKAIVCIRDTDAHKVPTGLTNHGVEDRRIDIRDPQPVITNRLLQRCKSVG